MTASTAQRRFGTANVVTKPHQHAYHCRDCEFYGDPRAKSAACVVTAAVVAGGKAVCLLGKKRTTPFVPVPTKEEIAVKKWTLDDIAFVREDAALGKDALAETMGRSAASVQQMASKQGIGLGKNATGGASL